MNRNQFIEFVRNDLASHGVKLVLVNARSLSNKYGGWYADGSRRLTVARHHVNFTGILLHEYCHFRQWIEDRTLWNKLLWKNNYFFEWLDSRKPVSKKVLDAKIAVLTLEYDCERRALKLIKKLHLPLSVEIYTQKANAYLLSYHLITTHHRWPENKSVYRSAISKHMPIKLLPLRRICNEAVLTEDVLKMMNKCF